MRHEVFGKVDRIAERGEQTLAAGARNHDAESFQKTIRREQYAGKKSEYDYRLPVTFDP